jgi:hypothetical protein
VRFVRTFALMLQVTLFINRTNALNALFIKVYFIMELMRLNAVRTFCLQFINRIDALNALNCVKCVGCVGCVSYIII